MRKRHNLRQASCGPIRPLSPSQFVTLYENSWPEIYGYCAAVLHDPDASEEAAQLTFSELWELLSECSPISSVQSDRSLKSELQQADSEGLEVMSKDIGIRLFLLADIHIDRLRKRFGMHINRHTDLEHALEIVDTSPSPHELAAQHELTKLLYKYLNLMEEDCRELLVLYFFNGLTHRQIARLLELDRTSVTKRLRHAIEEFQCILPYKTREFLLEF
jgi:RNA polymerase sigma factor (sigma-70 family)